MKALILLAACLAIVSASAESNPVGGPLEDTTWYLDEYDTDVGVHTYRGGNTYVTWRFDRDSQTLRESMYSQGDHGFPAPLVCLFSYKFDSEAGKLSVASLEGDIDRFAGTYFVTSSPDPDFNRMLVLNLTTRLANEQTPGITTEFYDSSGSLTGTSGLPAETMYAPRVMRFLGKQ